MKVILKTGRLVLVPETPTETASLATWKHELAGHVLLMQQTTGEGQALIALGPKPEACNEPIQISSKVPDPAQRLISNFAATPFELDGESYASVEGFWQGLKYSDKAERRRVAQLAGHEAWKAGQVQPYGATVQYQGESVLVGTWWHWRLMERACWAKFTQNEEPRAALLGTGTRPLTHRMRHDSKHIPGVIMAEIWMRIRRKLAGMAEEEGGEGE